MKAVKQVDVVISAVGIMQTAEQVKIIAAIKEAGNIKVVLFNFISLVQIVVVTPESE